MTISLSKLMLASAALAVISMPVMAAGGVAAGAAASVAEASPAAGEDAATTGAKNFIVSMGDRGINFLGNTSMSQEAKKAEFSKLLNDSFDMNTIGRFALGTYWNSATPAQQQEYQQLFREMIVRVYAKRFSDYKGQKFDVRTARKENDSDTIVNSFIIPGDGPEVKVDWRVRSKNGAYRVVDIIVEGVSMAMTQRSDFASVIQRGGGNVDVLLTHLRQQ